MNHLHTHSLANFIWALIQAFSVEYKSRQIFPLFFLETVADRKTWAQGSAHYLPVRVLLVLLHFFAAKYLFTLLIAVNDLL